jgi:sulfite exporter TauE/SafE/copper chaperone CopZ
MDRDQGKETYIIKFTVHGAQQNEQFIALEQVLNGDDVAQIDINTQKNLVRIISHKPYEEAAVREHVITLGLSLSDFSLKKVDDESRIIDLRIHGMTCRSCEVLIERSWKKIDGIHHVSVDATKGTARVHYRGAVPDVSSLQSVIRDHGYQVLTGKGRGKIKQQVKKQTLQRPSVFRIIGVFAVVLLLGSIASKLGLIKSPTALGSSVTLGAAFILGLFAATSSCLAVSGGVLLSSVAQFQKYHPNATLGTRMFPVIIFVAGRILAYGALGGIIGLIGKSLSPSPFFTGFLTLIAALYMLFMGLDMLNLAPAWIKRIFLPRLPKKISHAILDLEEKSHPLVPFALGAGTFFLPCGFTQSLQLYALTTGSFVASAFVLGVFALGTAPALLMVGLASSSLKGSSHALFYHFAGALVVVLGFWNISNASTLMGFPLPQFALPSRSAALQAQAGSVSAIFDGKKQIARMAVTPYGYEPSRITLRSGVPTEWIVDGTRAGGCGSVLVSRELGIQKLLDTGDNTFEFTPRAPGKISFMCSMGMLRGEFTVLPNS